MVNYFNFKEIDKDRFLITNDLGRFAFVDGKQLDDMIHGREISDSRLNVQLTDRGFISEKAGINFAADQMTSLREGKNYVFQATSLHIFVITNACNMNCIYCQANDGEKLHQFMDEETARKAVDIALSSPDRHLSFEIQGGEPLLNFPIIRFIVEYSENNKKDKEITYSVVSNLTLLTEEELLFFAEHGVTVSTSLDGSQYVHDTNRPFANGSGTFEIVKKKISEVREQGVNVGAILTTTRQSLSHAREIVDTYVELGFQTMFIRPLTPLGCAKKEWSDIGYTEEQFVSFYKKVMEYIFALNSKGIYIQENYMTILLSKIMDGFPANYMELRSPCGAGIGQLAYYVNGDVFTCDEGRMLYEMGDNSFRLGNVYEDSYQTLVGNPVCRTTCIASMTETVPVCCDCVYQPYCGLCPVISLALYGDVIPNLPNHYRCKINRGILDYIFSILGGSDEAKIRVIQSWRL